MYRVALLLAAVAPAVLAGSHPLPESCGAHALSNGTARREAYMQAYQTFCKSLTPKALLEQHSSYTQYLYNDEHKIIFAVNPKVMSTSSKMIVDALRHNGVVRDRIPTHGELQYVNEAPAAHQAEMFATYERVVFVRNPYARLYSAWTNKYRDMPGTCKNVTGSKGDTRVKCNEFYNNWVSIGRRIYSHAGLVAPEDTQELLRGVTWPMFINAVVAGAARDRHWITQSNEMRLCTFAPTFIASLEHSDDDVQALFDRMAATSPVAAKLTSSQFRVNTSKPPGATTTAAKKSYQELFPEEVKKAVDAMFAADFAAFAYKPDLACV